MDKRIQHRVEDINKNKEVFLNYLKTKFPLFHNSNFFFRDFHYGVKYYLDEKQMPTNYQDAELIARQISSQLENDGVLVKVNEIAWKVNYPEFTTKVPGDPL